MRKGARTLRIFDKGQTDSWIIETRNITFQTVEDKMFLCRIPAENRK